jgi:hypothetical protein
MSRQENIKADEADQNWKKLFIAKRQPESRYLTKSFKGF